MLTKQNFKCHRCGKCCLTFTVKLSKQDIKKIEKMGFKKEFFAETDRFYTDYSKYSLKKGENGCVFLEKKGNQFYCKVYDSKPEICTKYPFNEDSQIARCEPNFPPRKF